MTSSVLFESVPPGYPKLAALISKEKNYAIFRKFNTLNARNLLYLQAELTYLEWRLQEIDAEQGQAENGSEVLSSWPKFTEMEERVVLIKEIRKILETYSMSHN
jgi:hypothetical protein